MNRCKSNLGKSRELRWEIEVLRGPSRGWYWRLKSFGNHKVMSCSKIYSSHYKALKSARRVTADLDAAILVERRYIRIT